MVDFPSSISVVISNGGETSFSKTNLSIDKFKELERKATALSSQPFEGNDVSLPMNNKELERKAITLPIGPITRAKAKRFKDAISAMVERVEENDSKEFKNELNIFNFFEAEFRSS
ncbi:hypothetical protein GOBAR_DD29929 [Gossypium barbadense]|nr:hypothetical protein GOBAR_DD29929 [Gossypium barbadense]